MRRFRTVRYTGTITTTLFSLLQVKKFPLIGEAEGKKSFLKTRWQKFRKRLPRHRRMSSWQNQFMAPLERTIRWSTRLCTMMERSKKRLSMWKLRGSENAMTLSNLGDERALVKMKVLLAPDQDWNINQDRDPLTTIQWILLLLYRILSSRKQKYQLLSKLSETLSVEDIGAKILEMPVALPLSELLSVSGDLSTFIHEQTRKRRVPVEQLRSQTAATVTTAPGIIRASINSISGEASFYACPSGRVKATIDDTIKIEALLDSGSEVNIMPKRTFDRLDFPIDKNRSEER